MMSDIGGCCIKIVKHNVCYCCSFCYDHIDVVETLNLIYVICDHVNDFKKYKSNDLFYCLNLLLLVFTIDEVYINPGLIEGASASANYIIEINLDHMSVNNLKGSLIDEFKF